MITATQQFDDDLEVLGNAFIRCLGNESPDDYEGTFQAWCCAVGTLAGWPVTTALMPLMLAASEQWAKNRELEAEIRRLRATRDGFIERFTALENQLKNLPEYRGIFDVNAEYRKGDSSTFQGSLWIALRDVRGTRPGSGSNCGWQLAVKSGRDGRDGRDALSADLR